MTFYHASPSEVIQELESDLTSGLRSDQVQNRIAQFGENKLKEKKRKEKVTFNAFWHNLKTL